MSVEQSTSRRQRTITDLAKAAPRVNASRVVDTLSAGFTQLRDLLVLRLHNDVEIEFGVDSMIAPVSFSAATKQVVNAGYETEVYSATVFDDEARGRGYISGKTGWFLDWILHARLDENQLAPYRSRVDRYRQLSAEECRHEFVANLHHVVPESVKTPLVLFRLFPYAVRIVAAQAFGDAERANELRSEQGELLPSINDCPSCHGNVLEGGAVCPRCGNPIWTFEWLQE